MTATSNISIDIANSAHCDNVGIGRAGATMVTVSCADAVAPVPPFAAVTLPVVLVNVPVEVAWTSTENVQAPFTVSVAPESMMVFVPEAAVMAPPPQLPVTLLGVATTSPAGNVSVKPTPVSATAFPAGFVSVKSKLVDPP